MSTFKFDDDDVRVTQSNTVVAKLAAVSSSRNENIALGSLETCPVDKMQGGLMRIYPHARDTGD